MTLEPLVPVVMALAITILVITSTYIIGESHKMTVQMVAFVVLSTGSMTYLVDKKENLDALWQAFEPLDNGLKFALAILCITVTYFAGGMFMAAPLSTYVSGVGAEDCPAACDKAVTFDVPSSLPKEDDKLFLEIFDRLKKEIVADLPTVYEMPTEACKWVDDMIEYTVAGGKMNRGLTAMKVNHLFAKARGRSLSNKERIQSAALGWCIEYLQAFFLVADDIMDGSKTRRGQPCWYKLDKVKMIAINDSFILESCVYKILKRYFGTEDYYAQLVDLFVEVTRQTELGQLLDLTSQPQDGSIDLKRFTIERYTSIVRYKTAFYSFYLPVALGMITSGITDPKLYDKAKEILLYMGEYFQVQDDYLDCYGTPEQIGKVGTDIQDNKCGWLVIQALRLCNSKQRKVLEENYGRWDDKKVAIVKKLYVELDIESVYHEYEEKSYQDITALLKGVHNMPKEVFEFLLNKIYKRKK